MSRLNDRLKRIAGWALLGAGVFLTLWFSAPRAVTFVSWLWTLDI